MHHTIERITSNPQDYKKCEDCGLINWYENENCWACGSTYFREMTEKEMKERYKEIIEEYGEKGLFFEVDV